MDIDKTAGRYGGGEFGRFGCTAAEEQEVQSIGSLRVSDVDEEV